LAPKSDIEFLKCFLGEKILVNSPYYEKEKKGEKADTPLVCPPLTLPKK
jgi:hypothetical protein